MPPMPCIINNASMNMFAHVPLRVSERASLRYRSPGAAVLSFPRHCPLLCGKAGSGNSCSHFSSRVFRPTPPRRWLSLSSFCLHSDGCTLIFTVALISTFLLVIVTLSIFPGFVRRVSSSFCLCFLSFSYCQAFLFTI